jgi:hypothetical protein
MCTTTGTPTIVYYSAVLTKSKYKKVVGTLNDSASQPYWAESRGGQNISTYFYCVAPWGLFLLLTSRRGRWNFCRYWRSSVGWILGWDNADAGDYVADISVVLLLLSAEFSWCRFWNWHIFSTIITYYCSTTQAIWKACNFTIYSLKQIYIQQIGPQALCDLTLANVLPLHWTSLWIKLTKYTRTVHFVPSTLRQTQ